MIVDAICRVCGRTCKADITVTNGDPSELEQPVKVVCPKCSSAKANNDGVYRQENDGSTTLDTTRHTMVRSPDGENRRRVELSTVTVPDLWHIAIALKEGRGRNIPQAAQVRAGDAILEAWHLAHDLLENLRAEKAGKPL